MANFKNLAMSKELAKDSRISIKKSLLGLSTKAIYAPTESKLLAAKKEYTAEDGARIERAMKASADKRAQQLAAIGQLQPATLGNYLLEACRSADGSFAAMQLFQYSQMSYQPVTDVCCFEGDEAKTVANSL